MSDRTLANRVVDRFLGKGKVVIPTPGLSMRGVGKRVRNGQPEYYCLLDNGGALVSPSREGFRFTLQCNSVPSARALELINKLDLFHLSS